MQSEAEVIVTSGSIALLDIYQGLGITEVWFWKGDRFSLYYLREDTKRLTAAFAIIRFGFID
ncbi:MAG: hypothetical protein F6J93_34875 [Oscillatoria sp. SIO1A7]|nr:hypothetical protein [Oscillatoria sp. SIO1A7]